MSSAEAAHRPASTGRTVALSLAFVALVGGGVLLAWEGAGSLRPVVTASGLQFRTLKAGHGPHIGPQDAALMDYVLTADDGTVLDSSEAHGGPQPFTEQGLFPGFQEAMDRMQEGGHYKFTMPPKLAFGDKTPPPEFPKGSNLTFEVQVHKVAVGAAQAVEQQKMQQQLQQQLQQQGMIQGGGAPPSQ